VVVLRVVISSPPSRTDPRAPVRPPTGGPPESTACCTPYRAGSGIGRAPSGP
jgi:hypothetical protein